MKAKAKAKKKVVESDLIHTLIKRSSVEQWKNYYHLNLSLVM